MNDIMKYKFWLALIRLSELTADDSIDDGADFAYSIEKAISKLEGELV